VAKKKKPPAPPPPFLDRVRRYMEVWIEHPDWSYTRLARATGWKKNTVKSDLRRIKTKGGAAQALAPGTASPSDALGATPSNGSTPTKSQTSDFEWDASLRKVAEVAGLVFAQTVGGKVRCECGRDIVVGENHEAANKWARTFARLYVARQGAIRIQFSQTNIQVAVGNVVSFLTAAKVEQIDEILSRVPNESSLAARIRTVALGQVGQVTVDSITVPMVVAFIKRANEAQRREIARALGVKI